MYAFGISFHQSSSDISQEQKAYLDVLPYVRFGVDDAHIGLIGPSVDQDPIVHLQKGIACIILDRQHGSHVGWMYVQVRADS